MKLFNQYLEETFGCKVYKISLSTGCTCPNRDGKISTGGCTFCSAGGSGEFGQTFSQSMMSGKTAMEKTEEQIERQIDCAIDSIKRKLPKTRPVKFIAYFQSFTNTYETQDRTFHQLSEIFSSAINDERICALSIGTRPDCISSSMLSFLAKLNEIKPVWIELGLQTIHEKTATAINRGYSLEVFEETYKRLKQNNLSVIVHTILFLPGESMQMMEETVRHIAGLVPPPDGIKFQLLQILRGTKIAREYEENPWYLPTMEEYILFVRCLAHLLPDETVIHRLTGDGPKALLMEPKWCANKRSVLNELKKHFPLG